MNSLNKPKPSTAVLDVTRFGRYYWYACAYATVVGTLLLWPRFAHHTGYYLGLFQIGCFLSANTTSQLRSARALKDNNAIWGNRLALWAIYTTFLAMAIRLVLSVPPLLGVHR